MKVYRIVLTIVFSSFILINCAHNPYKNNFVAEKDNVVTVKKVNEAETKQPKLYVSKNMTKAITKMKNNGYILVGSSEFENGLVSYDKAIEQAKNIDALYVVVQKENTGNYVGYYPKKFNSGITGRKIPKNKSDFVDIPYLVEKYGYVATFWTKKM